MPRPSNSNGGAFTVFDMLRAGVRRRVRSAEMDAAQSTWDSEGGAIEDGAPLSLWPEGYCA